MLGVRAVVIGGFHGWLVPSALTAMAAEWCGRATTDESVVHAAGLSDARQLDAASESIEEASNELPPWDQPQAI